MLRRPEITFGVISCCRPFERTSKSDISHSRFLDNFRVVEHTSTLGDHPFGRLVVLQFGIHSVERHSKGRKLGAWVNQ